MVDDLEGISVFLAVAEARNFRLAGERLGVTRSAVSQALQRLEDRLGVALVQRTTRSVSLTEAGEVFFEAVRPSVRQVRDAMQTLREMQARPSGLLRLTVSSIAESFLSGTLLAGFIEACPEIKLDITITDDEFDIVEAGFDAGVRLGEVIEQDMIAISVSERQRQYAVASPAYLDSRGRPRHPGELQGHCCIGWRPRPDTAPYRWEFTENGRDFEVSVDPAVTTNDMGMMIRMACAGAGITFGMVETFQPYVERGELVPLLEDFCPPFPGFYLYYPRRQRQPLKLRALVDHIRTSARR
ncbi:MULTISPECIES: LysR family transcriptional regulator [Rhizobium]|uniref:LysR family transcriptional regulator n=1 Tax=Rhizobium TaxID=379 RepID=UPI000BE80492|nr:MULTISPECIES: LysR family transcriptional regulator [Rhizobium]MBY4588378.1 LysR family transcriptional regulator [Rhizobium redzepovicii]MBY4614577.1 LysR family transcriptional regulator [Rhizobium redzepovicii]MDF0660207.1 LysR family transcriptional regulator [Rhizobium sp. BC49]PDS86855.1 LysR family transcriptional regulator [Rhizobium sp. L18]TBY50616.1 LysR family transcriptional regulator [Rhizobium leguminosarum bv. viciae]